MNDFQKNFRTIRKVLGWSQSKCGKELDFQTAEISQFETGSREPGLKNIIKICEGFRVSPNTLLGWNENEKGSKPGPATGRENGPT